MIGIPESRTLASDLRQTILGKAVTDVLGNYNEYKFTFYYADKNKYKDNSRTKR